LSTFNEETEFMTRRHGI